MAMPSRDKVMRVLREAPLNKVTLMFTGVLDELKRDLELLHRLNVHNRARQILVRRIEHTKESNHRLLEISKRCIAGYEKAIQFLNANYPNVVFTVPVLTDAYRGGSNEYFAEADARIRSIKEYIGNENRAIDLICAECGYRYFTDAFSAVPKIRTHLVMNHLYGGSVTVSGLLNHQDILAQVDKSSLIGAEAIVPSEMYNSDDCDLTGQPRVELERQLGVKVTPL